MQAAIACGLLATAITCLTMNCTAKESLLLADEAIGKHCISRTSVASFAYPAAIATLPSGDVLAAERGGRLYRISGMQKRPLEAWPIPTLYNMLDLAVSPKFHRTGHLAVSYMVREDGKYQLIIVLAHLTANEVIEPLNSFRLPLKDRAVFSGGRMLFYSDGIFVSVGDAMGTSSEAQDTRNPLGSIVRIPVAASSGQEHSTRDTELIAYGIRNSQGLINHLHTNSILFIDHGPDGGDELNRLNYQTNYGWPIDSSGGIDGVVQGYIYAAAPIKLRKPLFVWTTPVAPSGLAVYRGKLFPEWNHSLLVTSLAGRSLRRLVRRADGTWTEAEVLLKSLHERLRDVDVDTDGYIYLITDGAAGKLLRLAPIGCDSATKVITPNARSRLRHLT